MCNLTQVLRPNSLLNPALPQCGVTHAPQDCHTQARAARSIGAHWIKRKMRTNALSSVSTGRSTFNPHVFSKELNSN